MPRPASNQHASLLSVLASCLILCLLATSLLASCLLAPSQLAPSFLATSHYLSLHYSRFGLGFWACNLPVLSRLASSLCGRVLACQSSGGTVEATEGDVLIWVPDVISARVPQRLRCPAPQRPSIPAPRSCHQSCLVPRRWPGRHQLLVPHQQPGQLQLLETQKRRLTKRA